MSAISYAHVGMFHEAVAAAERAYTNRQSDQAFEVLQMTTNLAKDEDLTVMYRKLGEQMFEAGETERANILMTTVPDSIADDPRLLALKFAVTEPKTWSDNSFVWYCGTSIESWDGNSLKDGGIGGSETAVIQISEELVKQGKEVVVYNKCDAPAGGMVVNGVTYMNHWEFNQQDNFSTIALWRCPQWADHNLKAKKLIVDMHDVSSNELFTPERLEKIDHVFVKTEHHRTLYPNIPDEKIVIVGNGIDLSRFEGKKTKNPNRFIYTSCASRGLENILDSWEDIRKVVPKAELHVFYGWNTYRETHKNDPARLQWVDSMESKMEQKGITNHGRVDQVTLAKEMMNSSVWLYPTSFEEIHCITALEMQAAEVYPITTGFAALAETQQSGVKIEGDPKSPAWRERFVNELLFAVKNPDMLKQEIDKGLDYVKECSWENVTAKWMDTIWE